MNKKILLSLAIFSTLGTTITGCKKEDFITPQSTSIRTAVLFDSCSLTVTDSGNQFITTLQPDNEYFINIEFKGKFTGNSDNGYNVVVNPVENCFSSFMYEDVNTANRSKAGDGFSFNYMNKLANEEAHSKIILKVTASTQLDANKFDFLKISLENCYSPDLVEYSCCTFDGLLKYTDEDGNEYVNIGTYYPQSVVTDSNIITRLNSLNTDSDGIVYLEGKKYVAMESLDKIKAKFMNGSKINKNQMYYYKFEPITYRVLSVSNNNYRLMAEYVLGDYSSYLTSSLFNGVNVITSEKGPSVSTLLNHDYGFKKKNVVDNKRAALATDFVRATCSEVNSNGQTSYTTSDYIPYDSDDYYLVLPNGKFSHSKKKYTSLMRPYVEVSVSMEGE